MANFSDEDFYLEGLEGFTIENEAQVKLLRGTFINKEKSRKVDKNFRQSTIITRHYWFLLNKSTKKHLIIQFMKRYLGNIYYPIETKLTVFAKQWLYLMNTAYPFLGRNVREV